MATRNGVNWGACASTAQLPNVSGATLQSSALQVGDHAYIGEDVYVCTDVTPGAAQWAQVATTASVADMIATAVAAAVAAITAAMNAALAVATSAAITDPPASSTDHVTIDATLTPRTDYFMAPEGNQTFDPTAAACSQQCNITKTTTSANKITLPAAVGWTYQPAGAANTAFDLPGSGTAVASATHQWTLTVDLPRKIVYVSPAS